MEPRDKILESLNDYYGDCRTEEHKEEIADYIESNSDVILEIFKEEIAKDQAKNGILRKCDIYDNLLVKCLQVFNALPNQKIDKGTTYELAAQIEHSMGMGADKAEVEGG